MIEGSAGRNESDGLQRCHSGAGKATATPQGRIAGGFREMREVGILAVITLALCLLVGFLFVRYQNVKGEVQDIEKRSHAKARELLWRIYRETEDYLAFFEAAVSDPSPQTPAETKRRSEAFRARHCEIEAGLGVLRSPYDRQLAKDLLPLVDAVIAHAQLLGAMSRRFEGYDELDMTQRSLDGQAEFFREEHQDEDLAGFLDRKASQARAQAAVTKHALGTTAQDLDLLTEDICERMGRLHAYFKTYDERLEK